MTANLYLAIVSGVTHCVNGHKDDNPSSRPCWDRKFRNSCLCEWIASRAWSISPSEGPLRIPSLPLAANSNPVSSKTSLIAVTSIEAS